MHLPRIRVVAAAVLGTAAAVAVTSVALGGTENRTNAIRSALDGSKPKNVILFIGDGMGTQEITAARYYLGARQRMNVDRMPFTGFDMTWSLKPGPGPDYTPDLAPDSASTATMWATGKKTIDERLSQGPSVAGNVPGDNAAYVTALEDAQASGKKVGNVSTADVTDATPASLASHISLRTCQGPANMAACASERRSQGGLGSIAEQEIDHRMDLLLGGGSARFTQTVPAGEPNAGETLMEVAQDDGFQFAGTAAELDAIGDTSKPVLGLFTTSHMTTEWTGAPAATGTTGSSGPRPSATRATGPRASRPCRT